MKHVSYVPFKQTRIGHYTKMDLDQKGIVDLGKGMKAENVNVVNNNRATHENRQCADQCKDVPSECTASKRACTDQGRDYTTKKIKSRYEEDLQSYMASWNDLISDFNECDMLFDTARAKARYVGVEFGYSKWVGLLDEGEPGEDGEDVESVWERFTWWISVSL